MTKIAPIKQKQAKARPLHSFLASITRHEPVTQQILYKSIENRSKIEIKSREKMMKSESKGTPQGFLSLIEEEIPEAKSPQLSTSPKGSPIGFLSMLEERNSSLKSAQQATSKSADDVRKKGTAVISMSKSGSDIANGKGLTKSSSGSKPISYFRSNSASSPSPPAFDHDDRSDVVTDNSSYDDSVEAACDEILAKNFDAISQLTLTATEEQLSPLADLFVTLCETAAIESELHEWCIKTIVSSASKPELVGALSLPQEIVKQSLLLSVPRWKKESLDCIILSLSSLEGPVDHNNEQGALRLIRVTEDFLDDLSTRIHDIPLVFREGRVLLNSLIEEKFSVKPLPYALKSFTNIIYHSIVQMARHMKIQEEQMHQIQEVLDLFKDVAERKRNWKFPFLEDFVERSKEKQMEWLRVITDEADVKMGRNIVDSSTRKKKPNHVSLLITKQNFLRTYHQLMASASYDSDSDESDCEEIEEEPEASSPDLLTKTKDDKTVAELIRKLDKGDWKKIKTANNGFTAYTIKREGGEILTKVSGRVKCDLISTVEFFAIAEAHPHYDSDNIFKTQRVRVSEDKIHMIGWSHPPWPITKRQFCVEETIVPNMKEGRVIIARNQLDGELQKGYIRVITKREFQLNHSIIFNFYVNIIDFYGNSEWNSII
eukprot:TRINITY_DN1658_c0_g1_i1.p1 TRINITY_DN1658_c0_g1~~TRINITY_DN1658_c0_g1_i1.p1  ORF type:complete len:659 (+),score=192.20 TRINITY_DN1658_c0_g1_i1:142-2118(+)